MLSAVQGEVLAMDRVYLKEGDEVVVSSGKTHVWDGGSFHLDEDGDLYAVKDGKKFSVYYAFDLVNDDPNYGKPYYGASEGSKDGHRS